MGDDNVSKSMNTGQVKQAEGEGKVEDTEKRCLQR